MSPSKIQAQKRLKNVPSRRMAGKKKEKRLGNKGHEGGWGVIVLAAKPKNKRKKGRVRVRSKNFRVKARR